MRRLFLTIALAALTLSAHAQVSYLEMLKARSEAAPAYIAPASLTPAAGTNKYMKLVDNTVVLYDYAKESKGEVVFTAKHNILSYSKSPDGTMALYEMVEGEWPRQEIYRHSYTSDYYVACADGSTIKIDDVRDISFSPDNSHLAMAYNNDIFLYNLATNEIYNITALAEHITLSLNKPSIIL